MVKFNVAEGKCPITEAALLCLLCNRKMSLKENYAHVFGREHIEKFIVSTSKKRRGTFDVLGCMLKLLDKVIDPVL